MSSSVDSILTAAVTVIILKKDGWEGEEAPNDSEHIIGFCRFKRIELILMGTMYWLCDQGYIGQK